ncbi:AMP-binding protein [Streptomyces cavernicola]|uniref:AMP-binding protein n=1 Tax=Streptomyces cavernicola TaxID=3043613 RepID=A0ABT6S6Q3_9ACTN|nr:AMP-binding protein [Streptomyces sp. B-S-A6]MDI3403786.1 AMP-binding protein [Streptomyces sp. B-S-A6]
MLDGCTPWPEEFVDRYWAAGHWSGCTLDNLLRLWALDHGPRTALVHGATRLTYANLDRRADRMAAGFRLRGIRPRQRVVVQLPNVPEFVVALFGLLRAGAVPVLLPLSYEAPEVARVVRLTEAVGYVCPTAYNGVDHMATAAAIAAQGPYLRRVFTFDPPGASAYGGGLRTDVSGCHYAPLGSVDAPPEPAPPLGADDVAFLLPCDDSTAAPTLVPRTHDDYAYQARAAADAAALTADDVYLAALPAASAFGLGGPGVIGTLCVGGTVVLAEDADPGVCLPAVERERVTVTSLTPAAVDHWMSQLPAVRADLNSLRLVQVGGGPLPYATAQRIGTTLGCGLQQVHGTAAGPLTLTRLSDAYETVLGTQGRPLSPDDEIRIVDAHGSDVPPGEPGELLFRGPYTPRGHYRAPEHDARAFTPDGFLRTGTAARVLPDGTVLLL